MKYFLLAILALLFLFPLYWMATLSVQSQVTILKMPPDLFPRQFTGMNFAKLLTQYPVLRWAGNTFAIVAGTTVLSVTISALAGYAFSMFRFRGREIIFWVFMGGIMITRFALLVPMFVILAKLHLRGLPAIILTSAFEPLGIYLFRSYLSSHVPGSYAESARMDGAGEMRILRDIMVPLCVPIIAALVVFKAVNTMQDYVWQMIVLQRPEWYTLVLGLIRATFEVQIADGYESDFALESAAGVLILLPLILVFAFTSKYFIKGLGEGGVKE